MWLLIHAMIWSRTIIGAIVLYHFDGLENWYRRQKILYREPALNDQDFSCRKIIENASTCPFFIKTIQKVVC